MVIAVIIKISLSKVLEEKQLSYIEEWKKNPDGIFKKNQNHKITEIKMFDELNKNPFHAGAKGELRVLKKLKQLSNDFHVLCGLNIGLSNYVTYNGKRNLRSAQMDFVVISKKGVILIEVKNWSTRFYYENDKISPHEQVDRAGRVLWIALKSWRSPKSPRVTSVLLPVQGNMRYDPRYKYVLVSDLDEINYFIEKRKVEFSDKEVERIVDRIKGNVTN